MTAYAREQIAPGMTAPTPCEPSASRSTAT